MLDNKILEEVNQSPIEGIFNKWNEYILKCKEARIKPHMNLDQFIYYCSKNYN